MAGEQLLLRILDDFAKRVQLKDTKKSSHTVNELRENLKRSWSDSPGVYYFTQDSDVVYVGSAIGWRALGNRIWDYTRKKSEEWVSILEDPNTSVNIVAFENCDWYWPVSLEALLIAKLKPPLNRAGKHLDKWCDE